MNSFSSGVITPPPSENGDGSMCCPGIAEDVIFNSNHLPPSPLNRRRDRSDLQQEKEANRSKSFTSRLQRSTSVNKEGSGQNLGRRRARTFHQPTPNLPIDHGLKALEPPREQSLVKMAFAEQQQWITVQQKTFTKW